MAGNPNFDTLATTTLQKYAERTLRDNIFNSSAFLRLLKERRNTTLDGGQVVLEPILFAKNTTASSYSGYDSLNNAPQSGLTAAQFSWKQNYASVIISGLENEVQNVGETQVIKLLSAKMAQAEESLISTMNSQVYSDGTGNGGKDIVGLALAVSNAGVYGNIDRTTETWWNATQTNVAGALVVEGGSNSLQRHFDLASKGGGRMAPDLGLTTRILYEALESFFTPDRRFSDSNLAQFGFVSLKFRTADITWDEDCTSGDFFFLNTKTFKLITHPARDYKVDGPKFPTNQDAKVWHILHAGALTCNEPRRNAVLTGLTNA